MNVITKEFKIKAKGLKFPEGPIYMNDGSVILVEIARGTLSKINSNGGINIIDLANIYSCSFIETRDIGKEIEKDSFEILGRFDHSEVRGCNLLSF